ncbi:MAG: ABC transporter permease [Bacteroidota bacterium]
MSSLLHLAVKNIMRHKRRSLLTAAMICAGAAAAILAQSYGQSAAASLSRSIVETFTGDIQIRAATKKKIDVLTSFGDVPPVLTRVSGIRSRLRANPAILATAPRLTFQGMLAGDERSDRAEVAAIEPAADRLVHPRLRIVSGTYLLSEDGLLLSEKIAKSLRAKVGQEFVLMAAGPDGYINAVNLRVQGIVASDLESFIGQVAYMDIRAARRLLYLPEDSAWQIDVLLRRDVQARQAAAACSRDLAAAGYDLRVDYWRDVAGIMSGIVAIDTFMPRAALAVILIVVCVGIINTVLMSVLERTREIGVMMALGTKGRQVLWLFLAEAGLIGLAASCLGGLIAGGIILYYAKTGIPVAAEAMKYSIGGDRLYLVFDWAGTALAVVGIVLMSIAAAFIPAREIARLKPVEALRYN